MYTYIGLGLMSVFAMMIIPSNFDTVNNELVFYGAGTITQYDINGNEVFSQTIHNRLVDTGETFMLQQTFQDTIANADNTQIGSICIFKGTPTIAETETAATFDTANTLTQANCKQDTSIAIAASVATVNPATFTCGGTNCADGDSISAFGVCRNSAAGTDYTDCATNGILFAVIDSADTTLNAGETLSITYNFDLSSSGT